MSAAPGLTRVLTRYADGRSELSLDPDLRVFVADLVRPYGLPLREDLLAEGVGHAYEELAAGLLTEALGPDEPADVLIQAFDSPDVRPGAPTSLALSRSCAGTPTALALCDQGTAGAFAALRAALAYQRTGVARRAVVVLAEQTALHHRPPEPVTLPDRHCAVVLVCETLPGEELTVRQDSGAAIGAAGSVDPAGSVGSFGSSGSFGSAYSPDSVAEEVRRQAKALGEEAAVLLAAGLEVPGLDAVRVPAGQPFTGLWSALADRLPDWRSERRPVLLADLDRRLGVLSTLTLRAGPPS
ncbi:hypothetical protein [Kitasatospora purpeofusca]|uniref:hypothetical protein n=1 Tax=Kitasatospora purpeofusca TaxID=67352 RepID=UPI002A5ABE98|nr:hypothetical protein [Kitasatospora purpeofusca]MDY0813717.1 hypothetical protein [Kitasatospora purpeofusca]